MTQPRRAVAVSVITRVVVCGFAIGIGVTVAVILTNTSPTAARVEGGEQTVKIQSMNVPLEPVAREWRGFGTIRALDSATIPAEVVSTVVSIPDGIEVGLPVSAGQVVARLRDYDYVEAAARILEQLAEVDAEVARLDTEERVLVERRTVANRDLELSEVDLQRVTDAAAKGAAVDREIDAAEQRRLTARRALITLEELQSLIPVRRKASSARRDGLLATHRLALEQVDRCTVTAPIAGILSEVMIEVGEQVAIGTPVARVVDPVRLELRLRIPASCRGRVRVGDRVVINRTVTADPIEAAVSRISPIDDSATRTMTVFVEIDGHSDRVVPGLFVAGTVHERDSEPRSVVPRRSVRNQRLMLIEDGRIRSIQAESLFTIAGERLGSGLRDRQWMVLAEPLPDGASIVVDGSRVLPDGIAVEARIAADIDDENISVGSAP
ncbi:MAG: HlyD family efflux transporter periplasmic adaptor subunit [Phycisphaerales bacterium]|nr:HlyD family efflux transporter periplasmic adaptor subunit [Phycisphaerales bacterium]